MAKSIKNKQYSEFWEDEKLEIQKPETKTDSTVPSEEIKKLEKKLTKKVSGLEKEIKELKEEPKVEEIQPVNKPRGWHAKNDFTDDAGNKFSKGKYVGKVEVEEEPKLPTKEQLKKLKPKIKEAAEKIIPDAVLEIPKKKEPVVKEKPQKKEPVVVINKPILVTPPKVLTDKDIYQQYINDKIPFKMYFRGNLIFDSKIQPMKNYPIFNDDGFILFGKNYIYRGIRIEKY